MLVNTQALSAAKAFSQLLPYHQRQDLQAIEIIEYQGRGRPRKDAVGQKYDRICATLVAKTSVIDAERQRARLFFLATNVLDEQVLTDDQILLEYMAQQSTCEVSGFSKILCSSLRVSFSRPLNEWLR